MRCLSFALIVVACFIGAPSSYAQTPRGSYLRSCTNIQFDGYILEALCQDAYGEYRRTRLEADRCDRVQNQNGRLVCEASGPPRRNYDGYGGGRQSYDGTEYRRQGRTPTAMPLPPGSWRTTCRDASIRGTTLVAACASVRGGLVRTTADVRSCRSFGNNNGQLSCE